MACFWDFASCRYVKAPYLELNNQAIGGSPVIAIGAGCVSDIAEPHERGTKMALFTLGSLLGTAFGPVLGGILTERLGWRWIFWFLAILTGAILVPLIL